ncbi:MAG TPA: CPBP family intramembrane glutamic endopeptidase, partial [Gemmatirosa sp.]|nr:CPBP family intramembrane glutamic endopeptidase [Gemmatirosa sp.]
LSTFVDLAGGGPDSVRALARDREVPLFRWAVRLYVPGEPREAVVRFAPDGRPIGLRRSLPEDERRATIAEDAGRRAADAALGPWTGAPTGAWRFVSASYETQPRSGRVDRTYTYERVGRTVGTAPIRARVRVTSARDSAQAARGAADLLLVGAYVDIPEEWERSYRERRAQNDLYAQLSTPGVLVFGILAIVAVVRGRGRVRWRAASLVGTIVGLCFMAAGLNGLPLAWFGYDTATATSVHVALVAVGAVAGGFAAGLWVTISVAAAELLTRRAFPRHHDWFAFVRHAGAPPVAGRVLGGYALAAFGFAYVTLFYLATRSLLGWWVPTGSLDDPNQIATPLPWVSAIGTSLFAGIWEESVFRAVPLAMLSLLVRDRPSRRWWMLAGVIVTALVFGFGHANYPSWPAYSRGVELFAEAALWAVLYLAVGLPTTIVAHVLYDLTWFGLFALNGRGPAYTTTAAFVGAMFFLPLLVVAVQWARRRSAGVSDAAAAAAVPRLGDVEVHAARREAEVEAAEQAEIAAEESTVADAPAIAAGRADALGGTRRRQLALVLVGAAALLAVLVPPAGVLGPRWSVGRARAVTVADSMLRARGVDPARWDRTIVAEA